MDLELLLGIGRFLLATTLLLLLTVPTAFIVIQMELKIIAGMNLRIGPNRIGPSGMFQSTIHGFKVLAKEDVLPDRADRSAFTLAPWMVFMAAAMSMLVIPFAPGAIAADFNIGIVYFFAVLGLSVVGLLIGGWASYNKYSLLGGLRSAAQMVSYEIPLTLSVVGVVVLAGTLSFSDLIAWQLENGWMLVWQPIGLGMFYIASLAEVNRTPFDMVEADSELVAGPFTEYSGMRFGFFFFAEYVALFIMSGILVTMFFGGWLAPWPFPAQLAGFAGTLWGIFWFFLKTYIFVFIAVWLRATLPRVRVDQLMGMAWKVLLPLALVNLFITAIAVVVFDL
ncbi:MAG TPA: NADH-quinone oxidoreductase subunit NuoH [Candidatus Limnocylindria bacterium]|nr:NADH-quinone oxidoreductase subunit NuoH [Candidatus Limnocylindria bacterium]